jgi:hypothetical protein
MPNQSDYIDAIKAVIKKKLVSALLSKLLLTLPFLSMPFLNPLAVILCEKIVGFLMEQAELRIFFAYSDFRTNAQGEKFTEAALRYSYNRTKENEKIMLDAFTDFASLLR